MDEQGTKTRDDVAPEKDPRDRHGLVGQMLDGRISIEGVVGEGGMGIVYLGHQTNVDRKVAIKVLLPERCDEETVQRFQNEAKAASRLSHPNTITIHDFGAWGDLLYIVMEFLVGESFQDVLDGEGPIEPIRVCHIASQVLASLQEAHLTGIIHRDIKPDNVFLKTVGGQSDFVKVLDFGVAKLNEQLRGGDATLTQAGMIFGTPKYMSPEQATARALDPRCDLYSVGVMMYEALTGRPPFEATDPVSILIQHVHDEPPPFAEAAPGLALPHELEQIVTRALQKKPEQRFGSALEMKQAIEHATLAMQANISTMQAAAVPSAPTGSTSPAPAVSLSPAPQPMSQAPAPQPSPTSPGAPTDSGRWADNLGIGGAAQGPSGGLGAPPVPVTVTHTGGSKGLLAAVILVGVLLLSAVGYLIYAQMQGEPGAADAAVVTETDAERVETPDAEVVVTPDAGVVSTPDAELAVLDPGPDPSESDLGGVAIIDTPDAVVADPADAGPALEDAVAMIDEPLVETPDVEPQQDVVAVVEDVAEPPEQDPVRVRFNVEPDGARLSFRSRDYRRDGRYYIFDRADGDRLRVNASADHYQNERVTADLTDTDDEGVVQVRVRLDLDPCDPANGPVDPYVCD